MSVPKAAIFFPVQFFCKLDMEFCKMNGETNTEKETIKKEKTMIKLKTKEIIQSNNLEIQHEKHVYYNTVARQVYEKNNEKSSSIAKKLFSEGRVHYLIDGDYSENSDADKLIKGFILSYKS